MTIRIDFVDTIASLSALFGLLEPVGLLLHTPGEGGSILSEYVYNNFLSKSLRVCPWGLVKSEFGLDCNVLLFWFGWNLS